ncbi:hypothetical protein SXCC_00016 [Gluconacetobacter sp. SXCC-1]|nr:hypothetical protein SXCC_00016 [Gluconacetobacter sp. SXCC-1]
MIDALMFKDVLRVRLTLDRHDYCYDTVPIFRCNLFCVSCNKNRIICMIRIIADMRNPWKALSSIAGEQDREGIFHYLKLFNIREKQEY